MVTRLPLLAFVLLSAVAHAQAASTPGQPTAVATTFSASLDWPLTGDDDADGRVTVRYRMQGTTDWKVGPALVRVPAGSNSTGTFGSGGGMWSNKHSGSLFDLTPGTTWEVELTLVDPDGGNATRTLTVSTRPIPQQAPDAVVRPVTPSNFAQAAMVAAPGDVLELAPGTYPTFSFTRSGTPGHPIVLRGASVDSVVVDGRIDLLDLAWVHLERMTVNGEVRLNGSSNMVVRGLKIRTQANGIRFEKGADVPRDNFIVDNDVSGGASWVDSQLSVSGYNGGEGIVFTGSGHVVCFNHVRAFRDDISMMEYDEAYEQTNVDLCNNDLEEATDDAVEADSAMGNVRVVRNRIKNCFDGLSSQPGLGGPTYFVRNTMFNVLYTPFKFHNGTVGDQVFHNTVVKNGDAFGCYAGTTWSRAVFRNNLFFGGLGGRWGGYANGSGRVFDLQDADATCSFDYDGVGSQSGFSGKIGSVAFSDLASLRANTTEQHAQQIDLSVFAATVMYPANAFPPKLNVDFALAASSAAIDTGVGVPGLNDDFTGAAPDLGALERGVAAPVYGPRPAGAEPVDAGTGGGGGGGGSTGGGAGGGSSTDAGSAGGGGGNGAVGGCGCASADAGLGLAALLFLAGSSTRRRNRARLAPSPG